MQAFTTIAETYEVFVRIDLNVDCKFMQIISKMKVINKGLQPNIQILSLCTPNPKTGKFIHNLSFLAN